MADIITPQEPFEPAPIIYTFLTDDGAFDIPYEEYLVSDVLRKKVWDKDLFRLFLGRSVYLFSYEFLASDKELKETLGAMKNLAEKCPIYFWAPHDQTDVDFLNDTTSTFKAYVGPNRRGKTTVSMIDVILDVVPNDPEWWMFKRYGVKRRDYRKPMLVGLGNYNISHHQQTNYPTIRRWIPQKFLGPYSPGWNGKGKREEPGWSKGAPVLPINWDDRTKGTKFFFFTYEQSQQVYESSAFDIWHWDEQPKEHLFDAADERTRTRRGRHVVSLTPHKVEGRPDTGAGSWIHDMCRGTRNKGHTVKVYQAGLTTVPDWVYPETEKARAKAKLDEAVRLNDIKAVREMRSRFYGEWHQSAGLVYDEISPDVHFIDDFDIGEDYTLYRAIDHGTKNPTACLWFAVDKDGFLFGFREYYGIGKSIPENVRNIVEKSGNTLKQLDSFKDLVTGDEIQRYEEVFEDEHYAKTVLDCRSFSLVEGSGRPINWMYRASGILVQKASGKQDAHRIPLVKELLRIDPERIHPLTGKKGSPRMFFFRSLTKFQWEWQNYVWDEYKHGQDEEKNPKEKARDKDNHLMTALSYACQIPMRYMGDYPGLTRSSGIKNEPHYDEPTSAITGY